MVDRAIVAALQAFLESVWRPTFQLLAIAAIASIATSSVVLLLVSELGEDGHHRLLDFPRLIQVSFLMSSFGGLVSMLYHQPLIAVLGSALVGAAGATGGWLLVRYSDWSVTGQASAALPSGAPEFAKQTTVLGLLVGIYFAYVAFRVHRTVTSGLTPSALHRVEPAATLFAVKAVLPLYGMLGVGIAALFVLFWFWERAHQWLREEVARRSTAASDAVDWSAFREHRMESWTLGGVLLVVGFVGWLVLSPADQDVIVGLVGGLAVIEMVMIFDSVRTVHRFEAEQYPDPVIDSELKLQGGEIVVYVFSIGTALILGALLVDAATSVYYRTVLEPAAGGFEPGVARLLATGTGSPADVLHYFEFYATGDTLFTLSVSLLTVLLPVIIAVFVLPFGVEYLYFRDYRTVFIAAVTLIGVVLLHVAIELIVSGEITHLSALSLTSLLPTISAGLSGSAVEWLKEEVGHAHCPSCDGRVEQGSNYCEHCGIRLIDCPNCGEFSAVKDRACLLCEYPDIETAAAE